MTDQTQVELAITKDNAQVLGVSAIGDTEIAPTVNVIDRSFGSVAPEPFPDIFGNQEWTMSSCSPTWSIIKNKDLYMKSKPEQRVFFKKEPGHDFDNYSMYYMPDKKAKGKDAPEPIRLLEIIFSPDRKRARIYDARFKATNKTIYQIGEIHDETQCIGLCRPRSAEVFGPNGDLRFQFKDTTNCCKCYTTCCTYGCCLMRSGSITSDVFKSQGEVSGANICVCLGNYNIKVPQGQYSPEELALLSFAFEYWLIRDIDQVNDIVGLMKKINGQCSE